MKKVLVSSLLVLGITITLQTVVEAKGPKVAYTQEGMTALSDTNKDKVTTISIDEIQKSLEGKKPITVSFDIDDTLLFSSQYFQYGKEYVTPGSFDFLHKQKFWDLVAKRGDKIVFITGRTRGSMYKEGEVDKTAKALAKDFKLDKPIAVNYTGDKPKKPYKYDKSYYIKKYGSDIHYGDSDDDIHAAREAGARPIRILRAPNSTNLPLPEAGGYGEEVLENSAY
ncbi:HAD family acid phosphatase [Streptococcus agalactiae]|uniref:HAD family acid phosphatase n=2 Tax=Streptococcus agalactiae TaxID=1311 RepID=UPI000810E5FE|nr:HAD family acid phosphatase [Streptococcus agalactiae]MCA5898372.1 acid phosphatase AphA [Streptococcus agalactiae]OCL77211.1 acid phosphatase AphA [Streptococcus agalactiae]OCM51853.1 acid phosphatase AphA [Streptococcus agalactiae]OCM57316.1 acid phosphatase AphA [Streptococcus agalactiae]OCM58614.1 acid phosphatase AphA [Streptococcus agalactiae]